MTAAFSRAEAAQAIADQLIPLYHEPLAAADVRIAFLFRETASRRGNKTILGKASKLAARARFLCEMNADAVIELGEDTWDTMTDAQRRALVDHELTHLEVVTKLEDVQVGTETVTVTSGPDMGKVREEPIYEEQDVVQRDADGRPKLRVRPHDFEEFTTIIERHGLWNTDALAMFNSFAKAKIPAEFLDVTFDFAGLDDDTIAALNSIISREHFKRLQKQMDSYCAKLDARKAAADAQPTPLAEAEGDEDEDETEANATGAASEAAAA